jgi:gelsolin
MDVTDINIDDFLEKDEKIALSKEKAAEAEAFLNNCGKAKLEVYRMEQFVPTLQPEESYGKFHEGDSYVVCHQTDKEYDLHYWHGKDCTADEMGSSAAFTVQLTGHLNKNSNHHLEEEMYESELFLSYFKKMGGVEYRPGGVESGFRDVTKPKEFTNRLLHIKGHRYPRIFPVDMKADSINNGDVFVLDANTKIYFWTGD